MNDMTRGGTSGANPAPAGKQDTGAKPEWAMSRREIERVLRARAGLPPLPRRWPWLVGLVVLLALAGGGAAFWQMRSDALVPVAEVPAEAEAAPVMELLPAEYDVLDPVDLRRAVRVSGTIEPVRSTQVSSEAGGRVESVLAETGDVVAAGDLLVQIDVEALTLELDLARSNLEATRIQLDLATAQLGRTEALVERGVASSSALDEGQSSVQGLRANLRAQQDQVRAAELRLGNASVRAPFDGRVAARSVEPGQYVSIGTPLMTLVDLSTVEMEASAPVAAGATLRPGQPVEVVVDGGQERVFLGEVARISPVAGEGTRTLPVFVRIPNDDGSLLGGMFATGRVVTAKAEAALALPSDAILEDSDGTYVLRIVEGRIERAEVEAGGTWGDDLVRIVSGLSAGDLVVTAPLAELASRSLVHILED
ncbi:efflux RND transporter periplasmic adaptor subunit [Marivita sp.]|uniref:efflux RND transporter periplasmic adaptor subunit n=1 Tax=Marivita sp. TaxID=2003365 RepID=UPI0025BE67D5|nr:efflux RND transporter periplasmic adaptor subunit [Marivita sp.]